MAANSAEKGQAHIVDCVLRAGRTLIVGVLAAEWGGGGHIGASGPPAHRLFRTSDLRYLPETSPNTLPNLSNTLTWPSHTISLACCL